MERARALASAAVRRPCTVHVSSGTYRLEQTLSFGPLDSDVHWKADGARGSAVVSGGTPLGPWRPSSLGAAQNPDNPPADAKNRICFFGRKNHWYVFLR